MTIRLFTTAGWGGTGTPIDAGLIDGVQACKYNTIDQAIAACEDGDVVHEDPESAAFFDSAGFRLHTITIPMGRNLTINKSCTLRGEKSRIRLDGSAGCRTVFGGTNKSFVGADVDFVSGGNGAFSTEGNLLFNRCAIVNYRGGTSSILGYNTANTKNFNDCLFINCANDNEGGYFAQAVVAFSRCTIYGCQSAALSMPNNDKDVIVVRPISLTDPGVVPADTFVIPPPDDPTTITDWSVWDTWDFRLKPTSSYATGNSLTSADGDVYDLAGNKRKVGGAKGAYEVLEDVTHYSRRQQQGWKYTVERTSDDAPELLWTEYSERVLGTIGTNAGFRNATAAYLLDSDGTWRQISMIDDNTISASIGEKTFKATNEHGECIVHKYAPSADAPDDAKLFMGVFISRRCWITQTRTPSVAITPTSCFYIQDNNVYESTASTVQKIYVPGWTHVDVGDVTAEIVLGKGASVRSTGKLTLKNETTTSEDLLERVILAAPAEFTAKDCDISDAEEPPA